VGNQPPIPSTKPTKGLLLLGEGLKSISDAWGKGFWVKGGVNNSLFHRGGVRGIKEGAARQEGKSIRRLFCGGGTHTLQGNTGMIGKYNHNKGEFLQGELLIKPSGGKAMLSSNMMDSSWIQH